MQPILKAVFIFLLSLLFFEAADAQKDPAVYYLKSSGQFVSMIESADFILTILPPDTSVDKDKFIVKEYYPDGKIRYISSSRTNELQVIDPKNPWYYRPILEGGCISFFPNGHKMKISNYENGVPVGDEVQYYPNGKLYTNKTYTKDKKLLCNECRDSTGKVLVENGSGKGINFIDEGFKNYVVGEVNNGLEEGEWYGKQHDTVNIVYVYKNGDLISAANLNDSGQKTYTWIEAVPEFSGGIEAFYKFLGRNIHYPAAARRNGTQGRVIISFIVEKDGTLSDVKASNRVGDGLDKEAVRVMKLSPPWKPGSQNGKPVRVAYSIPISFTISKD
jgi:TonB family protein